MSIQLYSHTKQDLEHAVEVILNKVQSFQLLKSSKESEKEDLISQKEACEFLNISLPTIISWRKDKDLPHYNYNGRFFYSQKELLEYGKKSNQK
jgi:hypothetical protein